MRVKETLRRAERRLVSLTQTTQKFKVRAEHFPHFFQTVSFDIQAAAFERAVFGECCGNKMPFVF